MATVYISDSSRRFPELPHKEMESRWEEGVGKHDKSSTCTVCGELAAKLYYPGGTCKGCRGKK
jgi:hypothetical protein